MRAAIQFPIVDVRRLLDQYTGLLPVPNWPAPLEDVEFIRHFGPIRVRPQGGMTGWVMEDRICVRQAVPWHEPGAGHSDQPIHSGADSTPRLAADVSAK
jgi:hypothetical protein